MFFSKERLCILGQPTKRHSAICRLSTSRFGRFWRKNYSANKKKDWTRKGNIKPVIKGRCIGTNMHAINLDKNNTEVSKDAPDNTSAFGFFHIPKK